MSYFEKNLALIKQYRPALFTKIEKVSQDFDFNDPDISSPHKQVKLHCGEAERCAYSTDFNSETIASVKMSPLQGRDLLVVYGLGTGEVFWQLLQQNHFVAKHIILVEKDPELFLVGLSRFDWSTLIKSSRFEIFVGTEESIFVPLWKEYLILNERFTYQSSVENFFHHQGMKEAGAYYIQFANAFKQALAQLAYLFNSPSEDAYRGLMNVSDVVDELNNFVSMDALENALKGKAVIVISSGPSLEQHLHYLQKRQENLFLVCADSSLKLLLKHRIRPDLVCTLERSDIVSSFFEDIVEFSDIPVLALPVVPVEVIRTHSGPIIIGSREAAFGKWLFPNALAFNFGNNVASMALRFLAFSGVQTIFLLGQDLAYSRSDKSSHSTGIHDEIESIEATRLATVEYKEIEGNNGALIPSTIYWETFKQAIENLIIKFRMNVYNVIGIDDGAKILNANRIDPEEFWKECQSFDFANKNEFSSLVKKSITSITSLDGVPNKKQTIKRLQLAVDQAYDLTDQMTNALKYDYPMGEAEDIRSRYRKHKAAWDLAEEQMKSDLKGDFEYLLKPLMSSSHYRIMTARNGLVPVENDLTHYYIQYVELTQEWLKSFCFWSNRIVRLFEGRNQ